ncbi:MAG: alanine--glyoxylate aminotransferase family protein [Deferribacteres bacterium]|nr:alanine--glyoxylate aminotransferase family protein [candidate division KSB1 bacterium]MCB9512368.1 alanine--glyoxylate aminotransferase family protein [Deferribacteres bacterium]
MPAVKNTHRTTVAQLDVPPRLLLGPGPSNAHPRVLQALGMRQIGHLDPKFIELMSETQELLRYAWQTSNQLTIPVSGTGSAAMEACFANLIEPGDVVLIGINGYFGLRMVDMAERYGAEVKTITKKWGEVFELNELTKAVSTHKPRLVGLVHAETSSGACMPMEGIGDLCQQNDCLLVLDTVTSLGGLPVFLDEWGVDAAYSGSQKCLSCPPGIAPLTFGPRAVEKLNNRQKKVANWYLDLTMVGKYWGSERTYHHTAPINMNYGLREALRLVAEEGLEQRWQRHHDNAEYFWNGLKEIGLECHVEAAHRLPSLTTVRVPEGVDAKAVQVELLQKYNIEIAGGLGELAGKVWRVGLMGFNSRRENVTLLLNALRKAI